MTLASPPENIAPGFALAVALGLAATALSPMPGWGSDPPPGGSGSTRLIEAIHRGDDTLLQSLLREGARADAALDDGTTALMLASLHGSARSVRLLLDHGADPGSSNRAGATALVWGAGDPAKVRALLKHGADPNARSKVGNTPLLVACRTPGATAAVELLLDAGAESSGNRAKNSRGLSPLTNAAAAGNLDVVNLLLETTTPPVAEKNRALARAAEIGHLEMARALLDAGADPNWDAGNRTGHVLDTALLSEEHDVATLLLEHGADPTTPTQVGSVPPVVLAAYTESGDGSVLQQLLARGAPAEAENARGESARGWAQRRGHAHLDALLENHGAPPPSTPPKEKNIPDRGIELGGNPAGYQPLLRDTARRSLDLLQRSSDVFLANRESCVSCHHQNLPAVAFAWARDRGFTLNDESIDRLVERQDRWMKPRVARAYELDQPTPVPPRLIGYGLLGHAALGRPNTPTTQALSHYLAATQQPDGHWTSSVRRPPMGGDEILATALAARAIQNYPPAGNPAAAARKVRLARRWLAASTASTHQQHAFKLLGLAWTGAGSRQMKSSARALVAAQRDDGGWSQLPGLPSDAWATGQSLVALHTAGALSPDDPAFVRGIEFLVNTQFDDGSWFVPTRSWPFQPHFDSQFPHGRDQWVSAGATAWATMAVVLAADPFEDDPGPAAAPGSDQAAGPASPVAVSAVDFAEHINPLFERSCAGCHGADRPKGNFQLTDRAALLRGGESGLPALTPGDGASSPLVRQVKGLVEDMEMPPLTKRQKYPALTDAEIALLEAWIDAGAAWDASENPND